MTRAMCHVSTLLGHIRHAYWCGNKKCESTLSHWMDLTAT